MESVSRGAVPERGLEIGAQRRARSRYEAGASPASGLRAPCLQRPQAWAWAGRPGRHGDGGTESHMTNYTLFSLKRIRKQKRSGVRGRSLLFSVPSCRHRLWPPFFFPRDLLQSHLRGSSVLKGGGQKEGATSAVLMATVPVSTEAAMTPTHLAAQSEDPSD